MPTDAEAISLPFEEAIEFFRQKVRVPTEHWDDIWRTAHSHSFMVAGATEDALLADFQDAIARALKDGTTLAEFTKTFDELVEKYGWAHFDIPSIPGWRAQIIYETNLSTASRRAATHSSPSRTLSRRFPTGPMCTATANGLGRSTWRGTA